MNLQIFTSDQIDEVLYIALPILPHLDKDMTHGT